jgi:hypothetical protein
MESVRVVEEAHFDDLAQVAMERDAAIRERDTLQARVAELKAASGGGYAGDGVVLECDDCGKRFWLDDTSGGSHRMLEPDNAFGGEVWESYCPACNTQAASGGGEDSEQDNNRPTVGRLIEDTCKQLATAMRVADIEKRRGDKLHARVKELEAASSGGGGLSRGRCAIADRHSSGRHQDGFPRPRMVICRHSYLFPLST